MLGPTCAAVYEGWASGVWAGCLPIQEVCQPAQRPCQLHRSMVRPGVVVVVAYAAPDAGVITSAQDKLPCAHMFVQVGHSGGLDHEAPGGAGGTSRLLKVRGTLYKRKLTQAQTC